MVVSSGEPSRDREVRSRTEVTGRSDWRAPAEVTGRREVMEAVIMQCDPLLGQVSGSSIVRSGVSGLPLPGQVRSMVSHCLVRSGRFLPTARRGQWFPAIGHLFGADDVVDQKCLVFAKCSLFHKRLVFNPWGRCFRAVLRLVFNSWGSCFSTV